jgi:hypothetical protein
MIGPAAAQPVIRNSSPGRTPRQKPAVWRGRAGVGGSGEVDHQRGAQRVGEGAVGSVAQVFLDRFPAGFPAGRATGQEGDRGVGSDRVELDHRRPAEHGTGLFHRVLVFLGPAGHDKRPSVCDGMIEGVDRRGV